MTNRIVHFGLFAALLLAGPIATAPASELETAVPAPRETPLVRAVQRARAAVVNIHSEKPASTGENLFLSGKDRKVNGMGTGIIIDERGYLLTNHHVVDGVDSLRVTLDDGGIYNAEVVSFDRRKDLAIIKIKATKPLPVMPIGTSSDLMLGETVIAVGNAFGYEHTVTAGIVSALSRDVEVNEKQSYENLIQTDASINPGNSGGPLLNLEGAVVGINVAIRAGAQRIGFAIPIDDARQVIARLLNIEQLNHTYHGLAAKDSKSGTERRLVVEAVDPESPAADAGFQPGDVVMKAGTVEVTDGADLERALLGRSAGETVEILVRRDSTTERLPLTLTKAKQETEAEPAGPADFVVRAASEDTRTSKAWRILGMRLTPIPSDERHVVGNRYRGGMRITEVRAGSPAESNGIQAGDVLVGLHVWETVSHENISYVLDHPQFRAFNPLKFYILRGRETLFGHLRLALRRD